MKVGGDGNLVDQGDLGAPKTFEGLKCFTNFGLDGLTGNPCFICFGVHATLLDDMQSNDEDVAVDHGVAGKAGVGTAAEEAQDKDLETVGKVPISDHPLLVFFTIFGCCFAVFVNKPIKQGSEDDVQFPEPHHLKGSTDWGRKIVKEDMGEGCIHCDDVSMSLLVKGFGTLPNRYIGVGYMAWKWIRISLESWMVSWYKNQIVQAGVSNRMRQCLIFLVLNVHIPTYLVSNCIEGCAHCNVQHSIWAV
jgi:hypothetical protein